MNKRGIRKNVNLDKEEKKLLNDLRIIHDSYNNFSAFGKTKEERNKVWKEVNKRYKNIKKFDQRKWIDVLRKADYSNEYISDIFKVFIGRIPNFKINSNENFLDRHKEFLKKNKFINNFKNLSEEEKEIFDNLTTIHHNRESIGMTMHMQAHLLEDDKYQKEAREEKNRLRKEIRESYDNIKKYEQKKWVDILKKTRYTDDYIKLIFKALARAIPGFRITVDEDYLKDLKEDLEKGGYEEVFKNKGHFDDFISRMAEVSRKYKKYKKG